MKIRFSAIYPGIGLGYDFVKIHLPEDLWWPPYTSEGLEKVRQLIESQWPASKGPKPENIRPLVV